MKSLPWFEVMMVVVVGCAAERGVPGTPDSSSADASGLPPDFDPLIDPVIAGACAGDIDGGMVAIGGGRVRIGCDPARHVCAAFRFPRAQALFEEDVNDFWIDAREVSRAEYASCVDARACPAHGGPVGSPRTHPAAWMRHQDAGAYCAWSGKRLPTWAEWEAAARGPDGSLYPWGDGAPTCERARSAGCGDGATMVGSLPAGATPCGVFDLAGNVAEWTAARELPDGSGSSRYYYRGGSYGRNPVYLITFVMDGDEDVPFLGDPHVGFRCARDR